MGQHCRSHRTGLDSYPTLQIFTPGCGSLSPPAPPYRFHLCGRSRHRGKSHRFFPRIHRRFLRLPHPRPERIPLHLPHPYLGSQSRETRRLSATLKRLTLPHVCNGNRHFRYFAEVVAISKSRFLSAYAAGERDRGLETTPATGAGISLHSHLGSVKPRSSMASSFFEGCVLPAADHLEWLWMLRRCRSKRPKLI